MPDGSEATEREGRRLERMKEEREEEIWSEQSLEKEIGVSCSKRRKRETLAVAGELLSF